MTTFVGSSALYAFLDADDDEHRRASELWPELLSRDEELATTNYVLVETIALLQRRLGLAAVRDLLETLRPRLSVAWVAPDEHEAALTELVRRDQRGVSLVDHVSFVVMRRLGIDRAFAFDGDFPAEGFEVL